MKPATQMVPLYQIRLDGGTQLRAGQKDFDWLKTLASEVQDGKRLKAVELCYDGKDYWPSNGHYRIEAFRMVYPDPKTAPEIQAIVTRGSRADAQDLACKANADQDSKQRTREDLKRSITLQLKRNPKWPDRKIARACAAAKHRKLVAQVRDGLGLAGASGAGSQMRTVDRGGKTFDMDTSDIGAPALPGGAGDDELAAILGKHDAEQIDDPGEAVAQESAVRTPPTSPAQPPTSRQQVGAATEPRGIWLALPDDLADVIDATSRREKCNREHLVVPVCLAALKAEFLPPRKQHGRRRAKADAG
jgi:hypothetical protein